ncbi:MAG: chromate transporter [Burkholderiaceae bacterium]
MNAVESLHWGDWLGLFLQYLLLSLLSVGGAISTAPEMHRYLVEEHGWINEAQFNASISIAQAAPGPNILFVALMGWHVGINHGNMLSGLLGILVTMAGILLPSTTLTYFAGRWGHRNRQLRGVRAFKQGMAPLVIALMLGTGWLIASAQGTMRENWPIWLLTVVSALIVWRTRIHLLWLLGGGAVLGWFGLV